MLPGFLLPWPDEDTGPGLTTHHSFSREVTKHPGLALYPAPTGPRLGPRVGRLPLLGVHSCNLEG